MLDELLGVTHPHYLLVVPPAGPSSQPGLYEDQLVTDISHVSAQVLGESDNHSGRVVLVTADGNDRSRDASPVPAVNGFGPEDFPSHLERINREFDIYRSSIGKEQYSLVVHLSTAEQRNTSRRFQTPSGEMTWGSGRCLTQMSTHWPMAVDRVS